jgi:hypothetical protein
MGHRRYLVAPLIVVAMVSTNTQAEPLAPLSDRFSLRIGDFQLRTRTDVRVDAEQRDGTPFDVENTLGFVDTHSVRVDGYWRFAPRHKLRLSFFEATRSESGVIDRDITFGDTIFPLDTQVSARLEVGVAELAYEYAFVRGQRFEIAGTLGLHRIRFDLELSETGALGSQRSERAGISQPVPVLGLRGMWLLNDLVHVDAQAQVFQLALSSYDARLEDYNISIVWMPSARVGFGIGYNYSLTRLNAFEDSFDGRLQWNYGGPRAFLALSFSSVTP